MSIFSKWIVENTYGGLIHVGVMVKTIRLFIYLNMALKKLNFTYILLFYFKSKIITNYLELCRICF